MNLLEAKEAILLCMENRIVPFLKSSPGVGKSTIVKDIAKEYNLELIDVRLSQVESVDLNGIPYVDSNFASYIPLDTFPIQGKELPRGKDGWLLFLDELPNASISVQHAAYRIILDREVGQYSLHENVAVVAAGNREQDKSYIQPIPSALKSRMVHLEVDTDVPTWLAWAASKQFDPRIIAFINDDNKRLDNSGEPTETTYACPRTWEFVNKLIKDKSFTPAMNAVVAGAIGQSMSVDFYAYLKYFEQIPDMRDVFDNPDTAVVPEKVSLIYATLASLASAITPKTAESAMIYLRRFSPEFQVVTYRDIFNRHTFATTNKHINAWARDMHNKLHGK